MRVVSGKYRNKKLETMQGNNTRPTTDRVKEAIFSMLANNIYDANVLDLFSGSGSLGIECLSRGASSVVFNDLNNGAYKIINKNLEKIEEKSIVYNLDYEVLLNKLSIENNSFDLIFLDPPYDLMLLNNIINLIDTFNLLNKNGIIICESNLKEEILLNDKYEIDKQKKYGNTKIVFVRRML